MWQHVKKSINWQGILFSLISAFVMISGDIFSKYDTFRLLDGIRGTIKYAFGFLGFFLIFYAVFIFAVFLMDYLHNNKRKVLAENLDRNFYKKIPLLIFVGTFIFYLIWLYYLRPNIATYDTINQIAQAFGWINLRNDNPVFHTLMMRLVLKIAFFFSGDVLISISVYEIFQILIFSIITTIVIVFIEKLFSKRNILKWILQAFYFINPLVGYYTVILWKDIWLSYFCLALIMVLFHIINENKLEVKSIILLILSTLLVLLSKGTGILYILVLIIFILLEKRENLNIKYKLALILVCTAILFEVFSNVFQKANNIGEHSEADTESVIWQTIGRTANKHHGEISKEDKEKLGTFIDLDVAADQYNREIADPVRNCAVNTDYFYAHRFECIKEWLEFGKKHKGSYLMALYAMSYGYLYPECNYPNLTYVNYVTISSNYANMGIVFDPNLQSYDIDSARAREAEVLSLMQKLDKIRRIPVVGIFGKIGAYFLVYLFLLLYGNLRKIKHYRIINAMPLAVFVGCVLSPVYSETRYAYPAILIVPVVITLYGYFSSNKDKM